MYCFLPFFFFAKCILAFPMNLQDREIIRVLVECCLQEKVFNKYYTALASKLCGHDKNHKVTLKVQNAWSFIYFSYLEFAMCFSLRSWLLSISDMGASFPHCTPFFHVWCLYESHFYHIHFLAVESPSLFSHFYGLYEF